MRNKDTGARIMNRIRVTRAKEKDVRHHQWEWNGRGMVSYGLTDMDIDMDTFKSESETHSCMTDETQQFMIFALFGNGPVLA